MSEQPLDFDKIAESAKSIVKFAEEMEMSPEELSHASTLASAEMNRRYIESLKMGTEKPASPPTDQNAVGSE